MPDITTAFGALKPKRKFVSIKAETKRMEKVIGIQDQSQVRRLTVASFARGLDKFPALTRSEPRA